MAILNITPDSFSDGGTHLDPTAAIAAGLAMRDAGAAIIDIGGESTRPRVSIPVPPEEEQRRILPVIRGLAGCGARLSVDTRNASTMAAALDAGADIINDISALAHDPRAAPLLAERDCPVVLMHMRGTPQTMHAQARYTDPAAEVARELAARLAVAEAAGIARSRIAIDPGIGFAKGLAENAAVLRRLDLLLPLGCPIVVGVSRKGFIAKLSGVEDPRDRLAGSLAAGLFALAHGATVLRVHDVAATMQALRVWQGLAIPAADPPA
jgi:dihydropteroate synthase